MGVSEYAHTIIQGIPFQTNSLAFDSSRISDLQVKYQVEESAYLTKLKKGYPLSFLKDDMSDMDVVLAVLNWTHTRWKHNGMNSPSKNDAITILKEAEEGQRFPCFAYAIVLRDQLNALGYHARTVYLKTEDAAHRKSSPGHVATEVYLNDLNKWIFLDGQFNVMPTLDGVPLNAVEFQDAINNNFDEFELTTLSEEEISKKRYINFIYDYLFYLDTSLDNRYGAETTYTLDGKESMMLVPLEAEPLTHVGYWDLKVEDYCIYTNSVADFYASPE